MVDITFFKDSGPHALKDLVSTIGGTVYGDDSVLITSVATLQSAKQGELSFFSNSKYAQQLAETKAGVCIIEEKDRSLAPSGLTLWLTSNAYESWAKALEIFYPTSTHHHAVSHHACVNPRALIGKNVFIGPNACVSAHAVIGDDCYIGENCYIGPNVKLGKKCYIASNCSISHAIIGSNLILHPGARIGQDGFGFAPGSAGITKVPQLGRVIIGDFVEVGANSCIDRGAIEDTIIGDHTKIDNLVQIGHNVVIGKYCIIVAQAGIAGSSNIGDGTILGGQTGVSGHVNVGKKVMLAAQGGIIKDVADGEVLGGTPAIPIRQWHKQTAILKKIISSKIKW